MAVQEMVASLRSMLQSADLDKDRAVWHALLDLCQEMATGLSDLQEAQDDLNVYVETIDEDLTRLEENLYGTGKEEDGDETPYLEVSCPHCHKDFRVGHGQALS